MDLEDMKEVLDWQDDDRPSGYSLPDVYTDDGVQEETAQLYVDRFQSNPLK
jgi:hypothetical protein